MRRPLHWLQFMGLQAHDGEAALDQIEPIHLERTADKRRRTSAGGEDIVIRSLVAFSDDPPYTRVIIAFDQREGGTLTREPRDALAGAGEIVYDDDGPLPVPDPLQL